MVNIFLTGATGYIGGEVLNQIYQAKRSHQISVLVRDQSKASYIEKVFPGVRVVVANLDDAVIIKQEASSADIVLNLASTSHANSAHAIAKGLSSPERTKPAYWIQMSGASLFSGTDIANGTYGEPSDKVYNDVDDTNEIQEIIHGNAKRVVDQLILSQNPDKVKTALLVGPLIYGLGRGPGNIYSIQAPAIARYTLNTGEGVRIGAGQSAWSNIHVHDLGNLCALLVQAAVDSKDDIWNHDGVYLPENGRATFGELGQWIAKESHARRLIKSSDVVQINPNDADKVTGHGAVLLATTAVLDGRRAKEKLGWVPSQPSLEMNVPEIVAEVAKER